MIDFKELKPSDFATYLPYFTNQRYTLCAYSLSSIIAWSNAEYKPFGAEYEDAFVVAAEFKVMKKSRHLLLPISPQRMFTPEELVTLVKLAKHTEYWFVPEPYVDHFGEEAVSRHFAIAHQGAYDDYIYRVSDLANLKGNRYSKKRNLIKQFKREYVDPGRVAIDPINRDNTEECLRFLEEWCLDRDCDADGQEDLSCEKQAVINTLNHYDKFDLKGLLLRIDGKVSAFGISAPLTREMATLQYEKALGSIKGLYQYFDNACARKLFNGYTYMNKESDMGIPGLTKAKKSYHPIKMVRSVKLILKRQQ
jgi:hypothetical protein